MKTLTTVSVSMIKPNGSVSETKKNFFKKSFCFLLFIFSAVLSLKAQTEITILRSDAVTPVYVQNGALLYVQGGISIDNGGGPGGPNDFLQNNGTIELVTGAGLSNFTNNVTGLKIYSTGQTTGQLLFAANSQTQTITGSGTAEFMNLTVNNTLSPKVNLSQNVTVDGILNIGGIINLQSNNLTLSSSGSLAGSPYSSGNMLQADGTGQFICGISTNTSYLFPVGYKGALTGYDYDPVNITFSQQSGGSLGIKTSGNNDPNLNIPVTPPAYLHGYWNFSTTPTSPYTYSGVFSYPTDSLVGSTSLMSLSHWNGSSWDTITNSVVTSTNTTSGTLNQSSLGPLSGDFTLRSPCVPPAVSIGGEPSSPPGICAGLGTSSFTVTATGTTLNYSWYENGGVTPLTSGGVYLISSSALSSTLTITNPPIGMNGNTYVVIVNNACGGTGVSSIPATLTVKPLPPLVVTPNEAVCTGGTTATLIASGAASYAWSPTTNLTPSAGTTATETAQISTLTIYTVTGTGSNGCTTNTQVPVATVAVGGTISAPFSIICSGTTKALSVINTAGHDYQWQISTDNLTWINITGATNTTYTTASGDGTSNKFYRLLAQSNSCWNVASTTAEVDVSIPNIIVTASNITDNSLILNWSPTGTGNYTISYSGPSSATLTSVTPAKTITGLTANGTYSITVTQTGIGCAASGTITGVTTLCAMPTGVTLSSPASSQILVNWTGVVGADYRVYYRPLFSYNTYFTKDVSNVSSVLLTKQGNNNLYASTTYEVYVSRLDCPSTGAVGQGTSPTNVTTLPNVSCATPSIDSVRSVCPVQIEVFIHDNAVNQYNVYIQRITPSILAVNSYGVSGTYFTINTPYSGDQYLIAVEAKCGGALSNLYVWPGNVTIKPLCTSPNNLVLSNPTCHGFTASWNADQCLSNAASEYALYLRVAGTINYNSYGVPLPANGIGPNKLINFVTSGRSYQVYVRSIYNCNGFVTYGPASQVETITTLSSGCRDEDAQQPEETKPPVRQYSADNQEVFSLYPNPNNGEFVADLSRYSNEEDAVRIEVINIIGQTVMTHLTTISGGHMSEFINLPAGTAAGTYIVRLTAGKNVYTTKVNISR